MIHALVDSGKLNPKPAKNQPNFTSESCKYFEIGRTGTSRKDKNVLEELILPKEKSGLCPNSWEVTSKLLEFLSEYFLIYDGSLRPHQTVYGDKMTQYGAS